MEHIACTLLQTWECEGPEYQSPTEVSPYDVDQEINSKIALWKGNITDLEIDAIVCPVTEKLDANSGASLAIHKKAGKKLAAECAKIKQIPTGETAVTPGFELPSKYIIHAVGPRGEQPKLLKHVYKSILSHIDGIRIRSIGLCCISTGAFGFPHAASKIALEKHFELFLFFSMNKILMRIIKMQPFISLFLRYYLKKN
ncbi:Appr-1-p processing enzyme family protein [Histomonas meleagridis]|uniref:Appr-1-p processing enzyme family protein n=1 Tax=Histomonas meleagridis TaxID=135588 RepID=UPI003559FA12|nr:Appr-1-p processing enzyme family protein [Histomonas meleagridis]KAH0803538.1 Appr-1-p processing enzyme family protein [Histomonas meleagridis]